MNKLFLTTGLALVISLASMSFTGSKSVTTSAKTSDITWVGKKVGGQHTGNINFKSSGLTFEKDQLQSCNFVVDMNSMTCTDLKGEYNQKLIGHLKSDDFFSVASNPTASFKSTKVESASSNVYTITGDLTIKGKTNTITFEATINTKGSQATASAKVMIDRSKYDVKYGSSSFFEGLGDNMIHDEFELNINVTADI